MGNSEHEARRDDGYRALGRYLTEFSELISAMESAISAYLADCGVPENVSALPSAGLGANSLTAVFFAMARNVHPHTPDDVRVAEKLKSLIREELPFRNDVAHGTWMVGGYQFRGDVMDPMPPTVFRTKPHRNTEHAVTIQDDLDMRGQRLSGLQDFVRNYGIACFGGKDLNIADFVGLDSEGSLAHGPTGLRAMRPD